MTLALWIGVLAVAVGIVVLLGAQVEMFEQMKQVRRLFGLEDGSDFVELPDWIGRRPSEAGLPTELDSVQDALVLFVSDVCATCHTLAAGFHGGRLPENLWVTVVHVSSRAEEFISDFALVGERIGHDRDQSIVKALGITMTPVAVVVDGGTVLRALTIPSLHQLETALNQLGREPVGKVHA